MRQIDNMTPQELDTLALKGMTAPRTASERPPTHVDMVHVEHRAKLAEQRLKEHVDALKWTRDNEKILAYQRDEAKAHADKLAEALLDLRTRIVATGSNCLNTTKADEALAAYEADSNETGDQQGENPNTIRQYRVLFTLRELVNGSFADVQHSTKWFNSPQEAQNHAAMKQENAQVVSRGYLITRKPTPQT